MVGKSDPGDWGELYCLGGMIAGNAIILQKPYSPLQFCEIEVFGSTEGNINFHTQVVQFQNSLQCPTGSAKGEPRGVMREQIARTIDTETPVLNIGLKFDPIVRSF